MSLLDAWGDLVDCVGDVGGVPGDDGVGDQGEAFSLEVLLVGLVTADFRLGWRRR